MRTPLLSLSLPLLMIACGGDDAPGGIDAPGGVDATPGLDAPGTFGVTGTVTATGGATVPAGATAFAVWIVSATSPDYSFKFGDGPATTTSFTVGFGAAPPTQALNVAAPWQFGVAVLALAPSTDVPAEGVIPGSAPEPVGFSSRHAIIFKPAGGMGPDWLAAFPEGYSCGVCVDSPAGFDSFAPVACSAVVIDVPADLGTLDGCNWT